MGKIQRIVVHCTASAEGQEMTKEALVNYFLLQPPFGKGWQHLGYHFLVHLNGEVDQLQPLNLDGWIDETEIANGAKGFNSTSIHVAYVGGLASDKVTPKDTRTTPQKKALRKLISQLKKQYSVTQVLGHRDLPGVKKACPCFDVATQL